MNILLTCAGRRHYLATFFSSSAIFQGKIIGADMDRTAPALAACDVKCSAPSVLAPNYLERLTAIIRSNHVKLVFSLNDLELELLSENRGRLEDATKAIFYVPPPETVRVCIDKWQTYRFGHDLGLLVPPTFLSVPEALHALASCEVRYPLIVKPRWGSGSIGLYRVESAADLDSAFGRCQEAVRKSILAPLGNEDCVIIQEFIIGPEYGLDILYGKDERFIGFAAKRKLAMRAGETDKALTVSPEPFAGIVERIARNLPHRGNLDCDFLERDGKLYLLEMNPRFGGGYPFTHLAGANHVAMLLADFAGEPLPEYKYDVGRAFAKYDCLVEVPTPVSGHG